MFRRSAPGRGWFLPRSRNGFGLRGPDLSQMFGGRAMIPMECPKCGRQGEVPLDRLNAKLTCRKCGTVFHMDNTGHIILGDPDVATLKKRTEEVRRKDKDIDLSLAGLLKSVPKPLWYVVTILILMLGGGFAVNRVVGSMGVPTELAPRSTYVGERFVDLELDEIKRLSTTSTLDDIQKWYDKVRSTLRFKGPRATRSEVDVFSSVIREFPSTGETMTTVRVASPDAAAPASSSMRDEVTLTLCWAKEGGVWLIDGKKTLAEASKPPRRRPTTSARRGGGL
jgi:hypothetical protein